MPATDPRAGRPDSHMAAFIRSGPVRLEISPARLVVIPGGRGSLDVYVTNRDEMSMDFDLTIMGIPAPWAGAPTPLLGIKPGEQRAARLLINVPPFPTGQPGHYAAVVRAARRGEPALIEEKSLPLIVAMFELEGRVGLLMETTRFDARPGEALTIALTASNHGRLSDTYTATLEGLPATWITSPAPTALVGPGEKTELAFTVVTPRGPSAQAGERPFTVRVSSGESPDQTTAIECRLDVPEVHEFGVQVLPNQTPAGQAAAVKIQNRGNAPTTYTLTWESPTRALNFVPPGPAEVTVGPGQTDRVAYLPRLRRRPLFGRTTRYPYTVVVTSAEERHTARAEVLTTGLAPSWLGTTAVFAAVLAVLFYLVVQWAVSQPPILTPTPDHTLTPAATPTVPPGLTPVG